MARYTMPGGGSAASVVWRPGAAGSGYVTTWAEVMSAFNSADGEFRVYLDTGGGGAFSIPVGTYALDHRLIFARVAPAESQVVVNAVDGAVLQNLAGVYRNITLRVNPTAAAALTVTSGRAIEFDVGSVLENQGSYAALEVAVGATAGLRFYRGSSALATSDVIVGLLGAGSTLNATFQDSSQASASWVEGAAGSTLNYTVDSSYSSVTLSTPPATVSTTRVDSYTRLAGRQSLWWSPVDYFVASGGAPALVAGSFTTGTGFQVNQSQTVTGVRFYWPAAGAVNIRCSLWNGAGVELANATVATSGIGAYTATFASPQTIGTLASLTQRYKVAMWENSGTNYTRWGGGIVPAIYPALPNYGSPAMLWKTFAQWAAGNAHPGGDNTGVEWFPVEPVFTTT